MNGALEKKWVDLYLANQSSAACRQLWRSSICRDFRPKVRPNGDRYHYTDLQRLYDRDFEYYFMPSYRHVTLPPGKRRTLCGVVSERFCIGLGGPDPLR